MKVGKPLYSHLFKRKRNIDSLLRNHTIIRYAKTTQSVRKGKLINISFKEIYFLSGGIPRYIKGVLSREFRQMLDEVKEQHDQCRFAEGISTELVNKEIFLVASRKGSDYCNVKLVSLGLAYLSDRGLHLTSPFTCAWRCKVQRMWKI